MKKLLCITTIIACTSWTAHQAHAVCNSGYAASNTSSATLSSNTQMIPVSLSAGVTYEISTCGSTSTDTYLRLKNEAGTQYAYSDDGCGLQSKITYTPTTTGAFTIWAGCYGSGSCSGSVKVTSSYSATGTTSATLSSTTKQIRVQLTSGVQYQFSTCGSTTTDTYLRLKTATGSQVAYNDDACGVQSTVTYTPSSSGEYVLWAGCYSSGTCSGVVTVTPEEDCTVNESGKVITLGDSFASGTGRWACGSSYDEEGGGYESYYKLTVRDDDECWRELHDTPGPRRAAAKGAESVFMACKGAEATHVENQLIVAGLRHPTKKADGWEDTEIIVSAGGNDLRTRDGKSWPDLLKHCILELGIGGCQTNSDNDIVNFYSVEVSLRNLYEEIAIRAPHSKVAVLGYPYLMRPTHNWLGWHCNDVTGINGNEALWIDDQVDEVNRRIQLAVNYIKARYPNLDIRYVDTTSYFPTGSCEGGNRDTAYVNDKLLCGLSTSDGSFHPGENGYNAYYNALSAALGTP